MTYANGNPGVALRVNSIGVVPATAGALAIVSALFNLWGEQAVLTAWFDGSPHIDRSLAVFSAFGGVLLAVTLIMGAVQIFRRDETGRFMVILASGLLVAIGVVALIGALTSYQPDYGIDWMPREGGVADALTGAFGGLVGTLTALVHRDWLGSVTGMIFPALTLVLALAPSTARWVAPRPSETLYL
ncbi:hypothetical protein [Nocardia sp. NPDC052566]|uniref:hypothetical protein n=1 Tax=Nocardia sp. NPDC052566 TaxID=3364330 RepID=UPI0037CC8CF2